MKKELYLDWAATSYRKPEEVTAAVADFFDSVGVSSGRGAYKRAFIADSMVFECRKEAAKLLNVNDPARIAFTSGATESINLALKGYLKHGDHVVTTSLEHNAVIRTLHRLKEEKEITYTVVKCDENGYFNIDDFKDSIKCNTRLFCINHASNVIGNVLPVKDIACLAHDHGIRVFLDAAQTAGSIRVYADELGADFIAFAGHKSILGPQGTGGLYVREGLTLAPFKEGGTGSDSASLDMPDKMPERFEAGTLNYPGIAGLKEAIKHINATGCDAIRARELETIRYMLDSLKSVRGLTLYGCKEAGHMVGVFSFNLEDKEPSEVARILDAEHDIMVRAGLHCAYLAHDSIGTIKTGAVRASIGFDTTEADIDRFIDALKVI